MMARPLTCWAMTTGEIGMISQAEGLAEATGIPFLRKKLDFRAPWKWLPGHLCPFAMRGIGSAGDPIAPPWPDLLITCGRRAVAVSIAVRRLSGGRTFTLHIQHPRVPPRCFDLVVPPRHDGLTGPNVIPTRVALHRLTPAKLAAAAETFGPRFARLPRPLVAVLIGGTSKAYRLTPAITTRVADQLAALARGTGCGLLITASRRTGAENEAILRERLSGLAEIWDGTGDNPYLGMLGLADFIVVTADSSSMVSEACSTGKPVYVVELEGGNRRFEMFHRNLYADGVTRPFQGRLEAWSYEPINETPVIARTVLEKLQERESARP